MMYKVTIFERYTQLPVLVSFTHYCCYDVQSYNFWKIYTTDGVYLCLLIELLWCTKLQFLKDIHNCVCEFNFLWIVVMMYKVTIFERYTQQYLDARLRLPGCYDVQSYNFWKIYTTTLLVANILPALLWCTKLQFLKDIHN